MVDGEQLTLSFTDVGDGDAVVFLHALGRSSTDWDDVIADVSMSFRCIAIDLPGHGHSSRLANYSFALFVESTRLLIDHLGLDSLAIVAHSMGGTTAWILAPDLGPRLTALVVEDTAVPFDHHDFPTVPATPPDDVTYDWEVRRQILAELSHPDPRWRHRLGEITAPVLLVAGRADDDGLVDTADRLPHGEVVALPVGHWIHQDAPADFIATIRSFLERAHPTTDT